MSAATASMQTIARAEPEPLGPDSFTWAYFGSYQFHLMLSQAFVLQVCHPVIDAGVGEHSVYKTDPWGRAKRSTELLWPIVYARPEEAVRKGIELRELHRSIKGVDKHGQRYHALDPEAYGWVHITGFDATVRMHEIFGTPPNEAERKQMFEEWRQLGAMMGIQDKHLPRTEEEYRDYFHDMIENRLELGEVAQDLLSVEHYYEMPRPPNAQWLPEPLWRGFLRVAGPLANRLTLGTLPPHFRERFGIRWTDDDERRFRRMVKVLRAVHAVTPRPLRYIPLARQAMRDARRHPEAYGTEAREKALQQLQVQEAA